MIPFDRPPMTSYRRSVVTMVLSGVVSEINGDFNRKLQIFPNPVYFAPQLKGVPRNSPWNWVSALGVKN